MNRIVSNTELTLTLTFFCAIMYSKKTSTFANITNISRLVRKVDVVVNKLRVDRSRVRLAEVEVGDEVSVSVAYRYNVYMSMYTFISST